MTKETSQILLQGRISTHNCGHAIDPKLDEIPQDERAPSVLDLDPDNDKLPGQRTLGLHWNMESDNSRLLLKTDQTPAVVYYL